MVYPIVAARSAGAHVWDLDGNDYVDTTMGFGLALFGHQPDFVTEAIRRQMEIGMEIGPTSPMAGEVAELLCKLTGLERVTFCNTGSEAVLRRDSDRAHGDRPKQNRTLRRRLPRDQRRGAGTPAFG
jgi:glutamate-1-semialdehyde aminotransferase